MNDRQLRAIKERYPVLAFLINDEEVGPLLAEAVRKKPWWGRRRPLTPKEFQDRLEATDWWQRAHAMDQWRESHGLDR